MVLVALFFFSFLIPTYLWPWKNDIYSGHQTIEQKRRQTETINLEEQPIQSIQFLIINNKRNETNEKGHFLDLFDLLPKQNPADTHIRKIKQKIYTDKSFSFSAIYFIYITYKYTHNNILYYFSKTVHHNSIRNVRTHFNVYDVLFRWGTLFNGLKILCN